MKRRYLLMMVMMLSIGLVQISCTKEKEEDDDDVKPVDDREQFIGEWSSRETYSSGGEPVIGTMVITKDSSNSTQIFISNLNSLGFDQLTYAIVTSRSFTIPEQIVCNQTIKGSGKLNTENTIVMDFVSSDGADADTVNAVLTKKS